MIKALEAKTDNQLHGDLELSFKDFNSYWQKRHDELIQLKYCVLFNFLFKLFKCEPLPSSLLQARKQITVFNVHVSVRR